MPSCCAYRGLPSHGGGKVARAHAGAEKSADAQVVTKGSVSLALSGKGRSWNLGVAFGAFIIEP